MCGEHMIQQYVDIVVAGSSPHVRGALLPGHSRCCAGGIIPACAGSTSKTGITPLYRRDHPRMCGEHGRFTIVSGKISGSSPHVRGARGKTIKVFDSAGIIPACAGSTCAWSLPRSRRRDHPRMCGEHCCSSQAMMSASGSSPHVRGALFLSFSCCLTSGIIPACAGSTYRHRLAGLDWWDHPRMCGEHA